ncbi:MAG: hypothetical protein LRY73_02550 [Bacillus sp. (in: Bacteria)]|nr:hypothetical protein [Bacillus sp. (in: firmicutes)]
MGDIFILFIDLFRNVKEFFFNEDGTLDKAKVIIGSLLTIISLGAITFGIFQLFS